MVEDGPPRDGRQSQPTVLVSGRARPLLERVPLQLLAERFRDGDGVVVATAREDPSIVARRLCGAIDGTQPNLVGLVDATSKDGVGLVEVDERRWEVPSPVSFPETYRAVEAAREELLDRGAERIHYLVDTLTTQFRLSDANLVHGHAHDLAMVAGQDRGVGVFVLDDSVTTDREFERLKHLLDVHVELRRTESGPEVRWTGLVGRSDGWVPLADAGFRFDALGKQIG